MAYTLDKRSQRAYDTLHPSLQRIVDTVLEVMPITIVCGFRGQKHQDELYEAGMTKVKWPDSKHNTTDHRGEPRSKAMDTYPAPISWGDRERMTFLAGLIMGIAHILRTPLRWGGDWDRDTEVIDNVFDDLGHYELTV